MNLKIPLIFIILFLTIITGYLIILNLDVTPATETKASYPVNVFAATGNIRSEFNQIHHLEYDVVEMNCQNKSELFINYLLTVNATGIKIMDIARKDGFGGHEVVLWNDYVFDATSGLYNVSKSDYISWIRKKGFDGIIVTTGVKS